MKTLRLLGQIAVFPLLLEFGRYFMDPLTYGLGRGQWSGGVLLWAFAATGSLHALAVYLFAKRGLSRHGMKSVAYWGVLLLVLTIRVIGSLYYVTADATAAVALSCVLHTLPAVLAVHVPLHLLFGYILLKLRFDMTGRDRDSSFG